MTINNCIAPAILILILLASIATKAAEAQSNMPTLHWSQLPSLPDAEGFASPFAGVSGNALIVAGGANFLDKRPWDGGIKKWYDSTFILKEPKATWQTGPALPRPIAYGVSITYNDSIICIGGG